jgi:aryl-phospho-beta-D-glucosidase BglC (GH1 family)
LKDIKEFGFNTVKIVIVPSMFEAEKDYCKKFLDPIVKECKKLNLYCWIDWHAHGNPVTGETRSPEILDGKFMRYDARKSLALKTWNTLSKRYGKEEHVIFEIFANPLGPNWDEWKKTAEELIEKIREFSNNIISVSGVKWMSDISEVLLNPLKGKNIIYSVVIYPNYKVDKKVVAKVKKEYPVNVVECGFIEKAQDKVFEGSEKDYAIPLNKFLKENKIGFMAWVYHPFGLTSKASILINSWDSEDLSAWGRFVKEEMLK